MPRDYAKQVNQAKEKDSTSPRYLVGCIALAVFFLLAAAIMYWLKQHPQEASARIATTPTTKSQVAKKATQTIAPVIEAKPRFDFYNMLPTMEVNIDTQDAPQQQHIATRNPASNTGQYVLQIASFRSRADAQTLVQRLANEHAKLYVSRFYSGADTWYRVQAGPFNNTVDAEKVQARLQRVKVDSLLRKQQEPK